MLLFLIQEALISIAASRLRSVLATLGIVIGVGSVVLLLAIGQGSRKEIEQNLAKLGSNLLIITPGSRDVSGARNTMFVSMTQADAHALAQLPSVLATSASTRPSQMQVQAGKTNWNTQITGVGRDYFSVRNWTIEQGENFSEKDITFGGRVAIVGSTLVEKLFAGENPLGRTIRVNSLSFRIIGLLGSKGAGFDGRDQDDAMYIPLATANRKLRVQGILTDNVPIIYVQARSKETMDSATAEIIHLLRERNKVKAAESDPFTIRSLTAISQTMTETVGALSLLLGAIASISLVVGGIGIMNIMLVTVTERTREIGIRKALGAKDGSIQVQFLLEAIMIATIGSVLGLIAGAGGALFAHYKFGLPVDISLWSVFISIGVAGPVGVLSGLYPARRASKLQPIEALRQVGA